MYTYIYKYIYIYTYIRAYIQTYMYIYTCSCACGWSVFAVLLAVSSLQSGPAVEYLPSGLSACWKLAKGLTERVLVLAWLNFTGKGPCSESGSSVKAELAIWSGSRTVRTPVDTRNTVHEVKWVTWGGTNIRWEEMCQAIQHSLENHTLVT